MVLAATFLIDTVIAIHRSYNMVFTLGLRHTFVLWLRSLALV